MFSDHWYRVANLKPALKAQVALSKHEYGGEPTWVLVDSLSGTQHRLGPAAHFMVARMNGARSVQQIWDAGMQELDATAPTQTEFIELLGRLHNAELLQTDITPDLAALLQKTRTKRAQKRKRKLLNPLYLKLSLFDPDRLLERLNPIGRILFSPPSVAIWLISVVWGILMLNTHWNQLTMIIDEDFTSPANLVMLAVAFVFMKLLHELAHGLAVKRWGGEVRDMGIVMLVLLPIPYVDASAANGFADKYKRVSTSAAGIMVELFLAIVGLTVWISVEPGLVKQFAANVMIIGTVSSLLFNGNPLLRFDGYYVLADLLEIPNLASRSQTFLGYLAQRVLAGSTAASSTAKDRREAIWLVCYGVLSFTYRILILFVIALFLSETFFAIGVLLAVWAVTTQIVWPIMKGTRALTQISQTMLQRVRLYTITGMGCTAVYLSCFVVPLPNTTYTDGIVWLSDESVVRSNTDCFVAELLVEPGQHVEAGKPLVSCANESLRTQGDVLRAQIQSMQMEYRGYGLREQIKRKMLADEIASLNAELNLVRERIDGLQINSRASGTFIPASTQHLAGRFYEQGEALGYVLHGDDLTIKAALRQQDIDLVGAYRSVQVKFPGHANDIQQATVRRQVPAPSEVLPSAVLGAMGGGQLAVDRSDPKGLLLEEPVYLVDLQLEDGAIPPLVGLRTHVLFEQDATPAAYQWSQSLRQLLMRRLDV
jgi:putative peptide zinc metalloprotease protein